MTETAARTGGRGMLVSFGGIDGSGKTTQVARVTDWLARSGTPAVASKTELVGTSVLFRLSEHLFGDPFAYHPTIPATLREFVVACDVAAHVWRSVEPALDEGRLVVWDRGPLCYRTYAAAYGADPTWISKIYDLVRLPDITFLLDLDPVVAHRRMLTRAEKPHQSDETPDFLATVRRQYLELARQQPETVIVDASLPLQEIDEIVRRHLLEKLRD